MLFWDILGLTHLGAHARALELCERMGTDFERFATEPQSSPCSVKTYCFIMLIVQESKVICIG